ncbi:c-type cytochrome [Mucilaginibacter sp. OK283]|uniref:c-type cytochrome n=1 Tax=Mucilaginibacter sp. OK283 TaxID=1881049 RepID=UPI0008BBCC3C|nr:c-type cytochrome [Mucilaginibacter sp. OK283]SEP35977.1 thiosulfate dehydrogenase [Mucilaginibacter sp. OK283]
MTKVSHDPISVSLLLVVATVLLVSACSRPVKKDDYKGSAVNTAFKAAQNQENIADAGLQLQTRNIPAGKKGDLIRYGRQLIASTALYFGPKGSVAHISNGMNCQNCHLDAGTRLFANNFAGFTASYPKKSVRSGMVISASMRISECFERSLNGAMPDTGTKEIKAIMAYMQWLGKNAKKGQGLFGNTTPRLKFMDSAANPLSGRAVFIQKCRSCHGANGEGLPAADKQSYSYPPLWGANSYNDGAGMYRIGNLAGFVKANMPFGATYQSPQLTDKECWDVAAYINSQPRPHKDQHKDYPDLRQKPIDLPFGPYADGFTARQHKYGPFGPIQQFHHKKA